MRLERFQDASAFHSAVAPLLLEHEAHHCVMLSVLSRLIDASGARPDEPPPLLMLLRTG